MDYIELKGMEFYALHGLLPDEKTNRQIFVVDAIMFLDLEKSANEDDISLTVNYAEIYEIVKKRVVSYSYDLIEKLCLSIVKDILDYESKIKKVRVCVHKPNAPIKGKFEDVIVCMERGKDVSVLP